MIAVHQRAFEKLAALRHLREFVLGHEMVFAPVDLTGTRRTCGIRHRQLDLAVRPDQSVDETRFAGSRRRADDEEVSGHGIRDSGFSIWNLDLCGERVAQSVNHSADFAGLQEGIRNSLLFDIIQASRDFDMGFQLHQ